MKLINGGTNYTSFAEFVDRIRENENVAIDGLKQQRANALAGKPVGIKNQLTLEVKLVSVEEIATMIESVEAERFNFESTASGILEELMNVFVAHGWDFPQIMVGRPEDTTEAGNIFLSFFTDKNEIVFSVRENRISSMAYDYVSDREEECFALTVADVEQKMVSFFDKGNVFTDKGRGFGAEIEPEIPMSEVITKMLKDLL